MKTLRRGIALIFAVCCICMQQTAFAVTQASETLFAMDTVMTLTAYGKNAETAIEQAKKIVLENEARWSVTKESSEVFHLNSQGSAEISAETFEIVSRALEMSELTDGAFDITVYPLVNAWGFTAGTHRVPDEAEIKELLLLVGRDKLTISGSSAYLNAGSMIDLGGIAKGYTGDMIIDAFKSCGINSALINLGGNVQTLGAKPDGSAWRIGIKSPYDETLLGIVSVTDKCVITSGAYERYFITDDSTVYGHIISPFTGRPADSGIVSASVVTHEGYRGDALSTALFVMGVQKAAEFWRQTDGFEMILLDLDGTLYLTEGISGDFAVKENAAIKNTCTIKR